jgi:flagella basal body P-ring formation protein FlgA
MRMPSILLFLTFTASLPAAELRLLPQCAPQGTLVTLGDVARISAATAEQARRLAAVELFPAPPAGGSRLLRVQELQDLLLLRGVNLAEHRILGSSEVTIAAAKKPEPPRETPLTLPAQKRSEHRFEEALARYLKQQTGGDVPRKFRFELTPEQSRLLAASAQSLTLQGGQAPFAGTQVFQCNVQTPEGRRSFPVQVEVTVPSPVVTVAHSLSRGAIVRPTDVVLAQAIVRERDGAVFHSLEEVVGKQTACAVPEGKPLTAEALQTQTYVHRGEVVTVSARAGGIRVRTTARAKDDGALGDLVAVETLPDRKTFYARVCGVRETEVMVQPATAGRNW